MHLVHLEEEGIRRDEDEGSDDLEGMEGVTEEFMVHLVRDVKNAQKERNAAITVVAQSILSVTVHL